MNVVFEDNYETFNC